ncbi:MAG: hypothetical protein ACD_39C01395G0001 [uncultured bacterium]|nr:MAG: hypothetical protein ACD_39C01395G0001 [uncultured bacterium]
MLKSRDSVCSTDSKGDSGNSAKQAKQKSLDNELPLNVASSCAKRSSNTNFPPSFGNRNQHDIHNTNSTNHKSNTANNSKKQS